MSPGILIQSIAMPPLSYVFTGVTELVTSQHETILPESE